MIENVMGGTMYSSGVAASLKRKLVLLRNISKIIPMHRHGFTDLFRRDMKRLLLINLIMTSMV